ncbi:MAG TPA: hypothetical protein VGO60_13190 [Iamia sp.]|nr:hypothetical protein [Iamia sp.]
MTLSDTDLDARLRAAGALLDERADERIATQERQRRRPGDRRLALAAAVLVVLALAGAAVIATRGGDDSARVDTGTTSTTSTERPSSSTSTPTDRAPTPEDIRALGGSGLAVTTSSLVDLATGTVTPLVSPGSPVTGSASAVPDGAGGLYYLSMDLEADAADLEDFGRTDLRHLTTDGDVVVEAGVRSFARRADGALALTVPEDPILRNGPRPRSRIDVVEPDGTRTTWTTDLADYQVTAWAGERLLGWRGLPDTEAGDALVFDGPGDVRLLGRYGGVRAVSPDGSWVIMGRLAEGEDPPDGDEPLAPPEVVDVATGETISVVDPGPVDAVGRLSWVGDDRLVGHGATEENTGPGFLVELVVVDDGAAGVSVTVTRAVALDERTFSPDSVWQDGDGPIMALATSSNVQARDDRPFLYVCAPDAETCAPQELPFAGHGGHPDDPSRPSASG